MKTLMMILMVVGMSFCGDKGKSDQQKTKEMWSYALRGMFDVNDALNTFRDSATIKHINDSIILSQTQMPSTAN